MTDGQTRLMQQISLDTFVPAYLVGPMLADAAHAPAHPALEVHFDRSGGVLHQPERPWVAAPDFGDAERTAVPKLVEFLLRERARDHLERYLDDLVNYGASVEHIFLKLFQPAARRLGELWLDDLCSFVDVTLATSLLQSSLRRLAPRFQHQAKPADIGRSAILVTLDRDQHTFGLSMAAEFFRRSGWAANPLISGDIDELLAHLGGERHAVVGFSVSRVGQLPALAAAIRRVRRAGRDRCAGVLVGGPYFAEHPEQARDFDADGAGCDARQAVAEAERLVSACGD